MMTPQPLPALADTSASHQKYPAYNRDIDA